MCRRQLLIQPKRFQRRKYADKMALISAGWISVEQLQDMTVVFVDVTVQVTVEVTVAVGMGEVVEEEGEESRDEGHVVEGCVIE